MHYAKDSASDMPGCSLSEPVVVDAQFVVGEAVSILPHTEVRQSVSPALDDGCDCRDSRHRLRVEVTVARLAWRRIGHFAIDNLLRDSSTLLLQFMVSSHAKDLTNR